VVGTYDGTVMKMYINGVLQTQTNNQNFALTTNDNDLEIGGKSTVSGATFNGLIDEVKIYNFALTADQVAMEYNQGQSLVLGSLSDTSSLTGGLVASNSASAVYCVPGSRITVFRRWGNGILTKVQELQLTIPAETEIPAPGAGPEITNGHPAKSAMPASLINLVMMYRYHRLCL